MNNANNNVANDHDDEIDLLQLLSTLLEGKWIILSFVILATLLAFIYAFGQAPVYKADTLLQVETKKSGVPGLEDLAGLNGDDTSVGTELELIKSRKILGKAVDELKLDIIAKPKRIKLLGNLSNKFYAKNELVNVSGVGGSLEKYAWANESIDVSRLNLPAAMLNQSLVLRVLSPTSYALSDYEGRELVKEAELDKVIKAMNGALEINIGAFNALAGTEFIVLKQSKLRAIDKLKRNIQASEKGKKTGIINLKLEGENKREIVKVLDHITKAYIELNKSRSAEEASNALVFLEEQIKPVEEKATKAELELKEYRTNNQTADMSMETQGVLQVASEIDTETQKLELKYDELIRRYTQNHPIIQALVSQKVKLTERKKSTLSKISKLPETQQKLLKLERDYKVANTVYLDLVNNIQEFRIAKASTAGNAYIIDKAVVFESPVKPKKPLILALGALLGGMLGVLIVFLRKALHQTIQDPEKVENHTGISVYATVPLTKAVELTGGSKKDKRQKNLLAKEKSNDPAIESLRSLRTSLHFALIEAQNNIVMITGPAPGIGKSFVSSNFSAVIAASGQKVILIDADMRKGYLHNLIDKEMEPGLSDLVGGKATIEDVTHQVVLDGCTMDVITRGQTPPNPSELLMHSRFEEVLTELSSKYDLVLIDTPPIHAVTDPAIIGKYAGVVFMVLRHDKHSMKEIEHAVLKLSQNGVQTKGFIYNAFVSKKNTVGYGGYGGYGYQSYYGEYKSDKS